MGKPRSNQTADKDSDRGNYSQYETGTEGSESNLTEVSDEETGHVISVQPTLELNQVTDTETEHETMVLRPRSKIKTYKKFSPRKPNPPRRPSRYRRREDQDQSDTGFYGAIKTAIQDMTIQMVSAIQNAFNGLTRQTVDRSPTEKLKPAKSRTTTKGLEPRALRRKGEPISPIQPVSSSSEDDKTDDEAGSESDTDTDSINTSIVAQSKHKPKVGFSNAKLPSFTGKEKWEVWINRFEAVASLQNWDDRNKLSELLTRLQGEAGNFVFDQLNKKTLKSYQNLVQELQNRFGAYENKRTYRVQFNRRRQKPNEDPAQYAAELKRIYDKSYSNRDAKIRQEDLLQRFTMGLLDHNARVYLELNKHPKTIEEAIQEVIAYSEAVKRPSQTNEYSGKENYPVRKVVKSENAKTKNHLSANFKPTSSQERKSEQQVNSNQKRTLLCYICGQPGHYARNCYDNPCRRLKLNTSTPISLDSD